MWNRSRPLADQMRRCWRSTYELRKHSAKKDFWSTKKKIHEFSVFQGRPGSRKMANRDEESTFAIDWSILVPSGFKEVLRDILLEFMGLPVSDSKSAAGNTGKKLSENIEEIYRHQALLEAGESGHLVRGIVYTASSLTITLAEMRELYDKDETQVIAANDADKKKLERAALAVRDWESFVFGSPRAVKRKDGIPQEIGDGEDPEAAATAVKIRGVTLAEIEDISGDPLSGGERSQELRRSVSSAKTTSFILDKPAPRSSSNGLKAKQDEDGGIRAKYMKKIMEKKMIAESKQGQGGSRNSGIKMPSNRPKEVGKLAIEKGWVAMAGASSILRHFRERGLYQCLLIDIPDEDIPYFEFQIGDFHFDFSSKLSESHSVRKYLDKFGSDCGLLPRQIMLVMGRGKTCENFLAKSKDRGYFLAQMAKSKEFNTSPMSDEPESKNNVPQKSSGNGGLLSWLSNLANGDVSDERRAASATDNGSRAHFQVEDMADLKRIIEDMNGVSFRKSTLLRSQMKSSQTDSIVIRKQNQKLISAS